MCTELSLNNLNKFIVIVTIIIEIVIFIAIIVLKTINYLLYCCFCSALVIRGEAVAVTVVEVTEGCGSDISDGGKGMLPGGGRG